MNSLTTSTVLAMTSDVRVGSYSGVVLRAQGLRPWALTYEPWPLRGHTQGSRYIQSTLELHSTGADSISEHALKSEIEKFHIHFDGKNNQTDRKCMTNTSYNISYYTIISNTLHLDHLDDSLPDEAPCIISSLSTDTSCLLTVRGPHIPQTL